MADEKFGIENIKKVVIFGATVGKSISDDLADNKITLQEVLALIPSLMSIPDLIANKQAIIDEAKDLSFDEIKEVVAAVEGSITNENVVGTIEDALNFIIAGKNLVERFSKKAETPEPPAA